MKDTIKEELIKRYKYIYENAVYILAPYMHEQTDEEKKEQNKRLKLRDYIDNKPLIYLKQLPDDLLLNLESFLLSDILMEKSKLYLDLESNKKNSDYLIKVKKGLELLEQRNRNRSFSSFEEKLNSWKLLVNVREFINDQSGDLKNKEKKLNALDEYFRINRYKNDGKVWSSGYSLICKDLNNITYFSASMLKHNKEPKRDKKDVGLRNSKFVNYVSNSSNHYENNLSLLTEKEKQDIYLTYHDELPWDLEIECKTDENTLSNEFLIRPEHTKPCGETFYIKEENIFNYSINKENKYYQICPHCGWIVNIPEEKLSDEIKQRIQNRCEKDHHLFRKMYLYSELFSLDQLSTEGQKKLLKK